MSSSSAKCDGKMYKIVDPFGRKDPASCNLDTTSGKRVRLPKRKQLQKKEGKPQAHKNVSKNNDILKRFRDSSRRLNNGQVTSVSGKKLRRQRCKGQLPPGELCRSVAKVTEKKKLRKTLRKTEVQSCGC